MKNIFKTFILIIVMFFSVGCQKEKDKVNVVCTIFPIYDAIRAVVSDSGVSYKMLVPPGSEIHSYEPTPKDIIDISNADVFIYIGGESDSWVEDILESIDKSNIKIIKLIDYNESVLEEETKEGMQEDTHDESVLEYDEHIWTDIPDFINIIKTIESTLESVYPSVAMSLLENANNYINKLKLIDSDIRDVINNSKRKELVFGDRFPFLYFVREYGLNYYAAFKGCSSETEADPTTISYLINIVKKDNIPVILKTELSNSNVANTIASETNTKVLELNSAHNITLNDFNNGITYEDIMKKNIEVLKEALN